MLLADRCRSLYCDRGRLECDDDDVNPRPAKAALLLLLLQRQGSLSVQMEGPEGVASTAQSPVLLLGRSRPTVEFRESSERLNLIRALGRGGAWSGSASGGL